LTGPGADVAVDNQLGAANTDAGDGAGVAAHYHRAAVHVVAEAPADVIVDFEGRAVGETRAEVPGGSLHVNVDCVGQADADVMARIGIDDADVLTPFPALTDTLVGFPDRGLG
jgi:hypothetical protein